MSQRLDRRRRPSLQITYGRLRISAETSGERSYRRCDLLGRHCRVLFPPHIALRRFDFMPPPHSRLQIMRSAESPQSRIGAPLLMNATRPINAAFSVGPVDGTIRPLCFRSFLLFAIFFARPASTGVPLAAVSVLNTRLPDLAVLIRDDASSGGSARGRYRCVRFFHREPQFRRMGRRLLGRQDDDGSARSPHSPLPYPRNRKRQLPVQGQLGEGGQTIKGVDRNLTTD
ncbi:hypothetical+protein [Methylocapsa aurea]